MNVSDLLLNSKDSKEQEDEQVIRKACIWLKEAGFPQYVQMFNDNEFPISLKLVQEDHMDFDGGSLMALFRRIEILNKAAQIKSESIIEHSTTKITESLTFTRKPYYEIIEDNENEEIENDGEEEDDDDENDDKENILEQTALSSNWSYEPRTRRWSHIDITKIEPVNNPGQTSPKLETYLGVPFPRPFSSKPNENSVNISNFPKSSTSKRPTYLTFEPILETNTEIKENELDSSDHTMSSFKDKNKHHISIVTPQTSPESNCKDSLKIDKEKHNNHMLRSASLKLRKAVSRMNPNQYSLRQKKDQKSDSEAPSLKVNNSEVVVEISNDKSPVKVVENDALTLSLPSKQTDFSNESYPIADSGWFNLRTGSFISRNTGNTDPSKTSVIADLDPVISLLESDVSSLDIMRSKLKSRASPDSAPNSPILRAKSQKPVIKKDQQRLSDFESYTRSADLHKLHENTDTDPRISSPVAIDEPSLHQDDKNWSSKLNRSHTSCWSHTSHLKDKLFPQYHILELSVSKINILKKLSILSCTSMLEKHCPQQKIVFNWKIPRLLSQKQKLSLENTNMIFGVNLSVFQNRYGQPFPPVIFNIFQYLRHHGPTTQGIFRKTGMKFRIKELRKEMENNPNLNSFDQYNVNDVADILKTFFRELPDRLLTLKLSSTLLAIYNYVPKEKQLEGLKWALFSLPDENRMALEYLIDFLSFLSTFSEVTKMDVKNLSLCFAPSLFNFQNDGSSNNAISPLKMKKSNGPNSKLLAEQNAAHMCVVSMINNSNSLFQITSESLKKVSQSAKEKSDPKNIINILSKGSLHQDWMREKLAQLKNDSAISKTGWTTINKDFIKKLHDQNAVVEQLCFRKIGSHHSSDDGIALRTWKVVIDIDVPSGYLLSNIKDKRHLWDPDITAVEVIRNINEYMEIVKFISDNSDGSFIRREFNVIRGYQLSVNGSVHMIFAESVNVDTLSISLGDDFNAIHKPQDSLTGQIFSDNFAIEPLSTKLTRVTWISRVDISGHHSDWYTNQWGHNMVRRIAQLKRFSKQDCSLRLSTESGTPSVSDSAVSPSKDSCSLISSQNLESAPETVL